MYTQSKQEQGVHLMEFSLLFFSFSLVKSRRSHLAPEVNCRGKQGCKTNSDVTYFTFHSLALFSFFHKYKPIVTRRPAGEMNNLGKTVAPPSSPTSCFRLRQVESARKRYMFCTIKHVCTLTHKYIYLHTYIHSNSMNIDFR